MKSERKPWMDENGNLYSNDIIIQLKNSWSLETWEEFLQSDVEVSRQEVLLDSPGQLDSCKIGYGEIVRDQVFKEQFPMLELQVRRYLQHLTKREQEVIEALFWDGKSQREVAREYKISRAAITNTRDRALKKLGMMFVDNVLSSKVFLGEKKESGHPNSDHKPVGREQDDSSNAELVF